MLYQCACTVLPMYKPVEIYGLRTARHDEFFHISAFQLSHFWHYVCTSKMVTPLHRICIASIHARLYRVNLNLRV